MKTEADYWKASYWHHDGEFFAACKQHRKLFVHLLSPGGRVLVIAMDRKEVWFRDKDNGLHVESMKR